MKSDTPGVWKDRQQTYFQERKKGEMNEMKNQLNSIINEPDEKKGREVIKKVIGYMTLGIDASPIFSQMCRASFTNDEVMKKMIYFYLTTYAQEHQDLSIMAINTFKKDCKHTSSRIRGMALRHLCSFKSSDYVDNILPVLREALLDPEPYVKKAAILGCLKLFYFHPKSVTGDESIKEALASMIRADDPLVSQNALVALDEIKAEEGGLPMTTKLTMYLLNRLKDYNEWGQTIILDFVYRYTPKNEKELFDTMNLLEDRLRHSSTALVLATIKIFMKYTKEKEKIFSQVVERIKSPMLTLMSSSDMASTPETTYVILEHIKYIIKVLNAKSVFESDFKYFYFKVDEPTYIKLIKLEILTILASQNNLGDMLNELNEYANESDIVISRKAVNSISIIALQLKDVTRALLKNLSEFYKSNKQHLVNQSICGFQTVLRKFPREFPEVKDCLVQCSSNINEPESTAAFVWLLGIFGESIPEAPYVIESLMGDEQEFGKLNHNVKQMLLTCSVMLFLKRPPQMQNVLSTIFKYIFNNEHTLLDLKDRASFYYRALQSNVEDVKKGFAQIKNEMTNFKWQNTQEQNEDQFNTLCLIYRKPVNKFLKPYQYFYAMRKKELGGEETKAIDDEEAVEQQIQQNGQQQPADLLNIDVNPNFEALQHEDLIENAVLEPSEYEQMWENLNEGSSMTRVIQNIQDLNEQSVEELFQMYRIYSIATSEEQKFMKFYMYAEHKSHVRVCLQLDLNKQTQTLLLIVKSSNEELASFVSKYVEEFLRFNSIL